MTKFNIVLFVFAFISLAAIGQDAYPINFTDRNMVIGMTNDAVKRIEEKNADEAIDLLVNAIAIDSVYRETYIQLYQAGLLKLSNSGKVMKGLIKGKRIFQEDDELCFYCGEIYRLNADIKNAIIEYSFAITYAKTNGEDFYLVPYYYFNRANCYLKNAERKKALEDYNYLLKLKPEFLGGLTNRGICLYELGRKDEACKDWKSAMDLGYDPAKGYYLKHCKK